ncbi:oxidoreductase [bacterium]|nr:MAG: oxidoreductase [bacterium]
MARAWHLAGRPSDRLGLLGVCAHRVRSAAARRQAQELRSSDRTHRGVTLRDHQRRMMKMTSALFDDVAVGALHLKNRLVHVATVGNYGREGLPTEELIAYYARRAKGGVGLIITEGVSVHPSSQPNPSVVRAYDPAAWPGLARLASAVHAHGVPIFLQLWHVGRQQLWGPVGSPWGVSAAPDALSGVVPHIMSIAQIVELENAFIDSAVVAKEAGFDGVEIHGAHGYLVTQFLSPWSNTRTDDYGGSPEGRMRFLRNILKGIRDACGTDFVLGLKLSGSEFVDGGLIPADTREIIAELESHALVDVVGISQGNFSLSLERHVPDMHFPPAPFADAIAEARPPHAKTPIIAIGRIMDRQTAEELVSNGVADLIGMARALISDPDLPARWRAGDDAHVRNCISCNICWGIIHTGKRMLCIHNPEVGAEGSWEPAQRTDTPRTIHVVGGGPAGMEAAWVAASRGHRVRLWEAAGEIGGQLRYLSAMPGLGEFGGILAYQKARLAEYGVDVCCGHAVTHDDVTEWTQQDDAVAVLATGSLAQAPPRVLAELDPLVPDDQRWFALGAGDGEAIVFDEDGSYYAYGPVDRLLGLGYRVSVATSRTDVGMNLDYLSRIGLQRRLRESGARVYTGMQPGSVTAEHLYVRDVYSGESIRLPRPLLTVWAGPRVANDTLARAFGRDGRLLGLIGDAVSPRKILSAIHEGQLLGRAL